MKLRWWRKCRNAEGIKDAEQALEREKQASRDVAAKKPAVSELAAELEKHSRENNFSKLFEEAMHLRRGSR